MVKSLGYADFRRYGLHSIYKRALYALLLIVAVLLIGTVAFHFIEGYPFIDAFYFTAMLITAEGPAITPVTVLGKLLASFMAFVGVGSVVFALAFVFGPFVTRIGKFIELDIEKRGSALKKDIKRYEKKR